MFDCSSLSQKSGRERDLRTHSLKRPFRCIDVLNPGDHGGQGDKDMWGDGAKAQKVTSHFSLPAAPQGSQKGDKLTKMAQE